MKKNTLISVLIGLTAAILIAATTEQIWQNIYNSSSNAIQVTVVGGSGTPVPLTTATPLTFGTPGVLAIFAATELGSYPGAACTPPALALSQSAAGAWTCATPVPPAATAVKVPFMAISKDNFSTGTTYLAASGPDTFDAAQNNLAPIAIAGTAKHLACWTSASAQTSTKTETITLNKNGSSDGLTCVINSTSTCSTLLSTAFQATGKCCEDTVNTQALAAGDGVFLKFVGANTPNVGVAVCQWEFDPS